MMKKGVSVSLLFPIRKTIVFKGYDWDVFCTYASVDTDLMGQAEARIPEDDFNRIVQAASIYTGDEVFGLHQGQAMSISDFGVLGYVMLHSKTIGKALEAYQKYNIIVCNQFNIDIEPQGEDIILHMYLTHSLGPPSRHCLEDMAASLYHTMRELSCRTIAIKEIQFMHSQPIGSEEEYQLAFGAAPQFQQIANTMRISKEVLDYPILSADTRLLGIFEVMAEEARSKLTQGSLLTAQISKWIIACMPSRFPTLQDAAKEMKMSVRTLQAKLKQENTSYNRLANEVRKELAIIYLAKPEYTISEIAYLLHFSEPSSFGTAFKKWTAAAPGEYRYRADSLA